MTFIEVTSQWHSTDLSRLTILDEKGRGKVQVEFLRNHEEYGHVAYIYDLYVQEEYRRQGIAKELMEQAIKRAKDFGFETAILEWNLQDTPLAIFTWYESLGFREDKFGKGYALMIKQLKMTQK